MNKFIALANTMKDEGIATGLVSEALMASSALYGTYAVTGNTGGLNPSGVSKMIDAYRRQLEHVQKIRREEDEKA
ncbi:MAG: DUF3144 domain-containing protein [Halieaceae bacterium]|nr:DUF3144 domain-containing protein [Halieaceae bacterium]